MVDWLLQNVPPHGIGLVLVLALSLMIGFEREERRESHPSFFFGGVRTYPRIALAGFLLTIISPGNLMPFCGGLLVLGSLLAIVYWSKLVRELAGFTTEFSALATYALGGIVAIREYWLAVAVAVVVVLLVHMKYWFEELARRISAGEVATFAKFLIISAVILPTLPDQDFTQFKINLYRTWMVVIAVSGVSYASYLLQRKYKERSGLIAASLLGGLYSSTVTTVVLAKQSKEKARPELYAGGIVMACSIMYLRVLGLLLLFNQGLFAKLAVPLVGLSLAGLAGSGLWIARYRRREETRPEFETTESKNPLEIPTALFFALIFMGMLVATRAVFQRFGSAGVFWLAGRRGLVDVDPFILSLAQNTMPGTFAHTAAAGIVVALASNNFAKAGYAWFFGASPTGRNAAAALALLGLANLATLLLI